MENKSTAPKPFVFVLMPFHPKFNDIYKFGIKGAADEVGAYAERVDEQYYTEAILERICNQIYKADVIVADMTGQNPNVFYEVGYAHALGKIVLLLTQNADDIPFDLKHRPHIVYGGEISNLKEQLIPRLSWAIVESKKESRLGDEIYEVIINDTEVPESLSNDNAPFVFRFLGGPRVNFTVTVRNGSSGLSDSISHIYLFSSPESIFNFYTLATGGGAFLMKSFKAYPPDATDGLSKQYVIRHTVPNLPPGAFDAFNFAIIVPKNLITGPEVREMFRLRLHSGSQIHDYPFMLEVQGDNTHEQQS